MEITLVILGWAFFLFTLPLVLELTSFVVANLFVGRSKGREPKLSPFPTTPSRIALLVPAHNEALNIARCVESLLASNPGVHSREVIVIADNCDDSTAEVARKAGARVLERFDTSVRGKGAAIDYAIKALMEEAHTAFVIVDADSIVDPNFFQVMGDCFSDGFESVQCTYLVLNVEATPRNRLMNLALLSMNLFRPFGREKLGASVGIMGNGFGLTKQLVRQVPYSANSITEDLEYHLKLITNGHRVRFVPETKVLADFPVSKEGTETQRERWEGGRFLLQRTFFFPLLRQIFSGRLRLIEPFLELMSLPLSYAFIFLVALVLVPYQPFFWFGVFGLAMISLQSVLSVILYGKKSDFMAFFEIPRYLFWKLLKLPKILLSSKKNTPWIRTKRD